MFKKILMLSDTHFSQNNKPLFGGFNVENSFNRLVGKVQAESPDFIFVTGDISQDGSIESYLTAKRCLEQFSCPKFVIMGNHDSANITHLYSSDIASRDYLDIGEHRFIFVSSYKGEGFNEGAISKEELAKIKANFVEGKMNYLVVHHHFILANSIIDKVILDNHTEFCEFIKSFSFKAAFHGHVHNDYTSQLGNMNVYANPSTCVQFAISNYLELQPQVGYRVLTLSENSYETFTYYEHL